MEEKLQDFNTLPEIPEATSPIIDAENSIDLGISLEDLKDMMNYLKGKDEKPKFLERFLTDTEGRVRDLSYVMNIVQLSRIPALTAMLNSVNTRLYDQSNLVTMDSKELSGASANLSREINNIMETSRRTCDSLQASAQPDSKYRSLLDQIMNMAPEKIAIIEKMIAEETEETLGTEEIK